MFVYIDKNGLVKEIINDRPFRNGDELRNKIYVYWDGTHAVSQGWVKFLKADETLTTETTFSSVKVGKELPTEPLRNLEYFSYDHTYTDSTGVHTGYEFYEITVPTEVLSSATPTSKLCACIIRFIMLDSSINQLGVIPFSVEASAGIIPDNSINETQYNYLIKLINTSMTSDYLKSAEVVDTKLKITPIIGGVEQTPIEFEGGGFKLENKQTGKKYNMSIEIQADGKAHLIAKEII